MVKTEVTCNMCDNCHVVGYLSRPSTLCLDSRAKSESHEQLQRFTEKNKVKSAVLSTELNA